MVFNQQNSMDSKQRLIYTKLINSKLRNANFSPQIKFNIYENLKKNRKKYKNTVLLKQEDDGGKDAV